MIHIPSRAQRLLLGVALLLVSLTQQSPAQKPVVLVHGINTSRATWNTAINTLNGQFGGSIRPLAWTTLWWHSLASQESDILSWAQNAGVPGQRAIVAGHSMGGLISRQLVHDIDASAILTVGSPHQGHPIIDNYPQIYWRIAELGVCADQIAVLGNWWIWDENDDLYYYHAMVWQRLDMIGYFAAAIVLADYVVANTHNLTTDMQPGSPYMQALNDNVGSENVFERVNLVASLGDLDEPIGPWRLFEPWAEAWSRAFAFYYEGVVAMLWSMDILTGTNWQDNYFWEKMLGGAALGAVSYYMITAGSWWSSLLGGFPHDGFIPVSIQDYPTARVISLGNTSHTEETSHPITIETIARLIADHP